LPEPFIQEDVATVPGIDGKKMSKSYNNYIGLFEDEKTLLKKVRSIVTDNIPIQDPKDPDKCNVYNILKLFLTEEEDKQIRERYLKGGLAYKDVKMYLYEKLINFLKPIQEKANSLSDEDIKQILQKGAEKANQIASKKIEDVYKKVGFIL
jgi:tryptophanyl-tRNA synthetase